jgi:hypothetical protein
MLIHLHCYLCKELKARDEFYINKRRDTGRSSACRNCARAYMSAVRETRVSSFSKPSEGEKLCRKCERLCPVTAFRVDRGSADGLFHSCAECQFRRHAEQRREALVQYGGDPPCCACCGERRYEFLAIDHIDGNGNQKRREGQGGSIARFLRKHGWPKGFRVLCHNCNMARGFYGMCPHEIEKERRA